MTTTIPVDVAGRRAAALAQPNDVPSSRNREQDFNAQMRSSTVERDGKSFYKVEGIASVVETWYEMYDFFGPYDEMIARGAFDTTLAADPDVAFLLNHRGMTMARTKVSKTLELGLNDNGDLAPVAYLNPERQDVKDMVMAIDDGDIDQMSFAFRIRRGSWNPDYTTYTIHEVDIDRGDVSAVNYGANPYTSISARAKQAFAAVDSLDGPLLRALHSRLDERLREEPGAERVASTSPTKATLLARLELESELAR